LNTRAALILAALVGGIVQHAAALGPATLRVLDYDASGVVVVAQAACPGATQVRLSERQNLIQHDWRPCPGAVTQNYVWLGPAGTGTLYAFFRDATGASARTQVAVQITNAVIDRAFAATYSYFDDSRTAIDYLPLGYYPAGYHCNTTEIGLWALSHILAFDQARAWSPTWSTTSSRIYHTLTTLLQWLQTNKVYQGQAFYQFYNCDTRAVLNYNVPSVDNALLDVCLYTIYGYCAQRPYLQGVDTLTNLCARILRPRNYALWYTQSTHRFGWLPGSPSSCDFYSCENRVINFIARASALQFGTWNFSSNEFALSLQHPSLRKETRSYDGITVPACNWDGTLFTYLLPAMFFNEMAMPYGTNSIDPAVACQVRYMRNLGRRAFGISDGPGPPGISYTMGCPPRASDNPDNDPDTGCVNPGALAMSLVTAARRETAAAVDALLTNAPAAFAADLGFRGTISVTSAAMAGVWSELDNGHAMLGYANACNETGWNGMYATPAIVQTHTEIAGTAPADFTPPVVWATPVAGAYDHPIDVALAAQDTPGGSVAAIWYTLDDSDPLTSATRLVYTGSFPLVTGTVVRISAADGAGNEARPQVYAYQVVPEPALLFVAVLLAVPCVRTRWVV